MATRPDILGWLRRRRERAAQVNADADMFVRELGGDAYTEARLMQNRANSAEGRRRWRNVALAIALKTSRRVGLDTTIRMSLDADPTPRDEPQSSKLKPQNVDPIDELRRLISDRDPKQ